LEQRQGLVEQLLKGLTTGEERSEIEAALELLRGRDIDLRTEVHHPIPLTVVAILRDYLKRKRLVRTANVWEDLMQRYLRLMVSYRRQSRAEFVSALQRLIEERREQPVLQEVLK